MDEALAGRVVAVTGAARGIGREIAGLLAEAGCKVALADLDGEAVAEACATVGGAHAEALDVTDGVAFGQFLARVEAACGPLDVLINNAGIMPTGLLAEESDALTERVIAVNTTAMILGSKRALELMLPRRRGHIVNIASTMGLVPIPGLATYNASKAAVVLFGETLAAEYADAGILASTILPGGVRTELASGLDTDAVVPLPGGRSVTLVGSIAPQEVAVAVLEVLVSGESHPRVIVPRRLARLLRSQEFMPHGLRRKVSRALKANEQILARTDVQERRTYLRRIGGS